MRGNLERHVLIGFRVRVKRHWDPSLEGLEGVVVWDYTRALLIRTNDGREKLILKDGALLDVFTEDGKTYEVEGRRLIGKPQVRARRR